MVSGEGSEGVLIAIAIAAALPSGCVKTPSLSVVCNYSLSICLYILLHNIQPEHRGPGPAFGVVTTPADG